MVMLKSLSSSMNAKIIGSGNEVVVLAHGYGGDQTLWEDVLPCLEKHYKVVVFDWCFSGSSQTGLFDPIKYGSLESFADDLVGLIEEMDIKSCVFVGHSMSGMIGCLASIKRPLLFTKLILIGASPRYLNSEDYEGGFEHSQIEQLLSTIEANFHAWASTFAPLVVGENDQNALNKFENTLKSMKPEIALAIAKLIFLGDYRHVLELVDTPCTLICTNNDIVVPSSVPLYMQKKMIKINSRVEIIDVDGHFPHHTALDQFLDVLVRILDD